MPRGIREWTLGELRSGALALNDYRSAMVVGSGDRSFVLTRCELAAALLLIEGLGPAQIAARLGVTYNAVKQRLCNIYRKARIRSGCQHIRLAMLLLGQPVPE